MASCAAALQFRIAWQSPNAAALHSHAFSPALMPSAGASLQLSQSTFALACGQRLRSSSSFRLLLAPHRIDSLLFAH